MINRAHSGQILIGAILVLLVLAILTPALVYLVQYETRTAVKQKRSTTAFYAAEAGVDRAIWMLRVASATFASR